MAEPAEQEIRVPSFNVNPMWAVVLLLLGGTVGGGVGSGVSNLTRSDTVQVQPSRLTTEDLAAIGKIIEEKLEDKLEARDLRLQNYCDSAVSNHVEKYHK